MERSVNELVEEVKKIYNDIGQSSAQAYQFRKNGKKGYAQACMVRVKYLHRKLHSLKQQLSNIIKGNISYITYEVITKNNLLEKREAILTNMDEANIKTTITLYCQINGLKFNKILEINKISTKLG